MRMKGMNQFLYLWKKDQIYSTNNSGNRFDYIGIDANLLPIYPINTDPVTAVIKLADLSINQTKEITFSFNYSKEDDNRYNSISITACYAVISLEEHEIENKARDYCSTITSYYVRAID